MIYGEVERRRMVTGVGGWKGMVLVWVEAVMGAARLSQASKAGVADWSG